tara:strand:- start:110 stop:328 length:219 start_codon:yes stop_codon:yes gene_type:complete
MNIKEVIDLVEKWIADPKSVSRKELKVARDAARSADDADDAYAARAASADSWYGDTDGAKFWVAEHYRRIND